MADEKVSQQQKPSATPGGGGPDLAQRVADLELQLAQARSAAPLGTVPEHAAGVGTDTAETWSQAEQTLAQAGQHPDQE